MILMLVTYNLNSTPRSKNIKSQLGIITPKDLVHKEMEDRLLVAGCLTSRWYGCVV